MTGFDYTAEFRRDLLEHEQARGQDAWSLYAEEVERLAEAFDALPPLPAAPIKDAA